MTANTGERDIRDSGRDYPVGPGDIPADSFAVRLVLARFHAGRLSIEKAAERCGLNSGNWVRWEDGARPRDKVEVAHAVASGLGMNFNWLLLGGPLLPARGRPVKRSREVRLSYFTMATRRAAPPAQPASPRPSDRPRKIPTSSAQSAPRRQVIDRSRPVAV